MSTIVHRLLLLLLSSGLVCAQTCGDLLAEMNKKPSHLEFLDCKYHADGQTKPFVARYRVSGTHAAEVERFLIREFGISKITRTCCVWASPKNSYSDKAGRSYIVEMGSEETLIDRRAQWRKVPYFYVNVELDTEEP